MSSGSLSEASSIFFVAFTFALLGFYIPGIFGVTMQFILHIYIILDLYLFLAAPFSLLQCVLGNSSLIRCQLHYYALFFWLNCSGLQCIVQCNAMCCSALQCSYNYFTVV